MEKAPEDIVIAIIVASILMVILSVFTLLFFLVFVRKKRILQKNKDELTEKYEKALMQAKIEIQEQTLMHISREIHDNIGQVLSFIKLSLGTAAKLTDQEKQRKIVESVTLISEVIFDLRDMSKSLSFERIKKEGLYQVIQIEADRLNRSMVIRAEVTVTGEAIRFDAQKELLLFRIFQEIMNNTLKHAQSPVLLINLNFCNNFFTLTVRDEGKGFETQNPEKSKGLGLENIYQRAALIGAVVQIESNCGAGTCTTVTLDLSTEQL